MDHSLVTGSSWLIAGSHVFHRLSTPRHPPYALGRLITLTRCRPTDAWGFRLRRLPSVIAKCVLASWFHNDNSISLKTTLPLGFGPGDHQPGRQGADRSVHRGIDLGCATLLYPLVKEAAVGRRLDASPLLPAPCQERDGRVYGFPRGSQYDRESMF